MGHGEVGFRLEIRLLVDGTEKKGKIKKNKTQVILFFGRFCLFLNLSSSM
jgi:hypothetical protein